MGRYFLEGGHDDADFKKGSANYISDRPCRCGGTTIGAGQKGCLVSQSTFGAYLPFFTFHMYTCIAMSSQARAVSLTHILDDKSRDGMRGSHARNHRIDL